LENKDILIEKENIKNKKADMICIGY